VNYVHPQLSSTDNASFKEIITSILKMIAEIINKFLVTSTQGGNNNAGVNTANTANATQ
jgi:hypothetical protein